MFNAKRWVGAVWCAALLLSACGDNDGGSTPNRLQGSWTLTEMSANGARWSPPEDLLISFTFAGEQGTRAIAEGPASDRCTHRVSFVARYEADKVTMSDTDYTCSPDRCGKEILKPEMCDHPNLDAQIYRVEFQGTSRALLTVDQPEEQDLVLTLER
jgi:hypothetical protein